MVIYVILQGERAYAVLAHMRKDSVKVKHGGKIKSGDLIGEFGHSVIQQPSPLHFHLMGDANALIAKSISCSFKEYELYHQDKWIKVENGIPKNKDRIRYNGNSNESN